MPFNDALTQRLVSLLPYPLTIYDDDGNVVRTLEASRNPVRIHEQRDVRKGDFAGVGHVPVIKVKSTLSLIPDPKENVVYIVSLRVMQTLAIHGYDVSDLVAPYDILWEGKRLKGCRSFIQSADVKADISEIEKGKKQ